MLSSKEGYAFSGTPEKKDCIGGRNAAASGATEVFFEAFLRFLAEFFRK
jgi:hypothetical protein